MVYLVWYYYLSVKFVIWIVKQKISDNYKDIKYFLVGQMVFLFLVPFSV